MPDDDTCHCGAWMHNSDHCLFCGCEQHESTCNERAPKGWRFGDD